MATVTRARLRALLGAAVGHYISSSATSAGAADGTTIVDTAIVTYDANWLANRWVILTSGTYSGQTRRISSVSSSTITMVNAFGGQVANAVTYEILQFDPAIYHYAMEQATRSVYPLLYLDIRDESLIVDNLIATNPDFETAVAAGDSSGWTRVNTPTLSDETTLRMHGTNSLKVVAGASVGRVYQAVNPRFVDIVGKTLNFWAWVYATAANTARIGISLDGGSTFTYSSYHVGDSDWEDLSVTLQLTANPSSIRVYLETVASGTGYFDLTRAWIDPIYRYTLPTTLNQSGPHRVYQQASINEPEGLYLPLATPIPGMILRLEGQGRLTVPTTETGTAEIDEVQAELLVAEAATHLFRNLTNYDIANREIHLNSLELWQKVVGERKTRPGRAMRGMSAHARDTWRVTDSSGTRTLELYRSGISGRWGR